MNTVIYGITHDPATSEPIIRTVRTVKVGIGVPRGKDIHVWIDGQNKWCVQVGQDVKRFEQMEEARTYYREAKPRAGERKAPRRLPYFTFTRPGMDGDFDHDFAMIAAHGPTPTEIQIVFDCNDPFLSAYQHYTASGLKCEGDGLKARRRCDFAQTEDEKRLAAEAESKGLRFFDHQVCALTGCKFAGGDKPPCKPHGRLVFQLIAAMRMGGSAQFDTTGKRSIAQVSSQIYGFKKATGRGIAERGWVGGIPLYFVVRPYRTKKPDGAPTTQFAVNLEYYGEGVAAMRREIMGYANDFAEAAGMLAAPGDEDHNTTDRALIAAHRDGVGMAPASDIESDEDPVEVARMDAEFYGDFSEDGDEAPEDPPPAIQMPRRRSESKGAAE